MARPRLRTLSAVEQQREVERVADEESGPAAAGILRALRSLRDGFTLADIEREIERGGRVRVEVAKKLAIDPEPFSLAITATLDGGVVAGRRAAVRDAPARIRREATTAAARPTAAARGAKWAAKRSAALVVDVSGSVRSAIRAVVADGVKRGAHTGTLAREVRQIIGLDERRAMAVQNFRAAQTKAGVATETIDRRATAYAGKLLGQRAETIARTEIFSAVNQGRDDLWSELVSEGVVETKDVTRTWVASRAENSCPICEGLDGETAGLNESFPGGYDSPPDPHPSCVCALAFKVT